MTKSLPAGEVAAAIKARFPDAVADAQGSTVWVKSASLAEVCRFLRDDASLAFDFLALLTAADYIDYFEVVYQLTSLRKNHRLVLKTRAYNRDNPVVPSVYGVWRGANLMEREVYDLMGVRFEGHPMLKRILTWDGFEGHPLRKDFLLQRP
ncbi:MAG: NADH-quinone oxidoreductase subunit C [Chloroflexi bacterium]|nr:NADH-quinone oxidoreductase subunit C [Chloroflexota bacterium]